jgi:hypothetical protein
MFLTNLNSRLTEKAGKPMPDTDTATEEAVDPTPPSHRERKKAARAFVVDFTKGKPGLKKTADVQELQQHCRALQ